MQANKRNQEDAGIDETDADAKAARVAQHYGSRVNQSVRERKQSRIYAMRILNNWVKTVQIRAHVKPGDYALDLACGKGGDLAKWRDVDVGTIPPPPPLSSAEGPAQLDRWLYVGVDIAEGSVVRDARERYNTHRFPFPAKLFVADCFAVRLDQPYPEGLGEYGPFDVVRYGWQVSCQFAFHYSFSTEERARLALRNVARLLRPGGSFFGTTADANVLVKKLREAEGLSYGNSVYKVVFDEAHSSKLFPQAQGAFGLEYKFTLEDAVEDCAEYLVRPATLIGLAREVGLEMRKVQNFAKYIRDRLKEPGPRALWIERGLGGLKDNFGNVSPPILSQDEWEASYLYSVYHFVKVGTPEEAQAAVQEREQRVRASGVIPRPAQLIQPEDIGFLKSVPREQQAGEAAPWLPPPASRPLCNAQQEAPVRSPQVVPVAAHQAQQQQPPWGEASAAAGRGGSSGAAPKLDEDGAWNGPGGDDDEEEQEAEQAPPTAALGWKARKTAAAAAAGAAGGGQPPSQGEGGGSAFADADLF